MPERVTLTRADVDWLCALVDAATVSPFEGGDPAAVPLAQKAVEEGAAARGFTRRRLDSPLPSMMDDDVVPLVVRVAATAGFLTQQPSLVVALGRPQPPERRIVINFHVDTVGPHVPPRLAGRTLHGRGAVDDKGPGVAAAVGAAAAWAAAPWLNDAVEVQIACVPGEEGGAMGSYGTRWLMDSGVTGRLNLFAEPTGGRVLDACSATMTPRLRVGGDDSTDDHPDQGHNATLALAFLAAWLGRHLDGRAAALGAKLCVAGLHTGTTHNRVYGTGGLLLNIGYFDAVAGDALAADVERLFAEAGPAFAAEFGASGIARRLVEDWNRVVHLDWLKRGLPPLANRDPEMEALLAACALPRHDGVADGTAFTCDAIWAGGRGGYVAICGPGRLDANGAHTPGEYVDLDDLDEYATRIRDLILRFGAHVDRRKP